MTKPIEGGEDHVLRQTRPAFLSLMDTDPERARIEIYAFTCRFFSACPPSRFRKLPFEDRDDVVDEIYLHCVRDGFRKLRLYRDLGRPFASWFHRLADNWIAGWMASRQSAAGRLEPLDDLPGARGPRMHVVRDPRPGPEDVVADREILETIGRCFRSLGATCQLLLRGALEGRSPRELVLVLGWAPSRNKDVSDRLRYCRRKLAQCAQEAGIDIGACLGRKGG